MFAYMATPLAAAFGEAWLGGGEATVALVHPLYEGEEATAQAVVQEPGGEGDALLLECWVENGDGARCAVGTASVGKAPGLSQPWPDYAAAQIRDLPADPPPLRLETAPVGTVLAPLVVSTTSKLARDYASMVFDLNPLFHDEELGRPLMHPGWLLGECNSIFHRNFSFGPWIHTRSELQLFAPAVAGRTLTFHGRLVDAYEKRGHHYALLDVFCVDDTGSAIMRTRHQAIFQIRQPA